MCPCARCKPGSEDEANRIDRQRLVNSAITGKIKRHKHCWKGEKRCGGKVFSGLPDWHERNCDWKVKFRNLVEVAFVPVWFSETLVRIICYESSIYSVAITFFSHVASAKSTTSLLFFLHTSVKKKLKSYLLEFWPHRADTLPIHTYIQCNSSFFPKISMSHLWVCAYACEAIEETISLSQVLMIRL